MASDRTRELATKWRKEFEAKHSGTTLDEEKLATLLDDALVALLDAFERDTQLALLNEVEMMVCVRYSQEAAGEFIRLLRESFPSAQPTPEVKK